MTSDGRDRSASSWAYRDYLRDPQSAPQPPMERIAAQPPRPGRGTVFLVQLAEQEWHASWQDEEGLADFHGTEDAAVAWAEAQPATEWLRFSPEADTYIPWRPSTP